MRTTPKQKIAVLKFSGSILSKIEEIPHAVHEIYQYLRTGYRVLAIVSAIDDSETHYPGLDDFERDGFVPPAPEFAELLATGETAAACLFTIGLERAGIKAKKLHHQCLQTKNSFLNSDPESLTTDVILSLFTHYSVLVMPGAIGCDSANRTTLLGRKGADYTTIYAAQCLHAEECVIYKETDGIYEKEIKDTESRRYESLHYKDLLKLSSSLIHHKAIKLAEAENINFSVKALARIGKTVIRAQPSTFSSKKLHPTPLNVILLGLGTVGFGVYKHLLATPHLFNIVGIAVNELKKHERAQLPKHLMSDNWQETLARKCDVVIELTGDAKCSEAMIRQALSQGCHVITANRTLIAEKGIELCKMASQKKVQFLYSACIGGAIPLIETLKGLHGVEAIVGVLSSTCNFILDKVTEGKTLPHTLSLTKILGLAENESSLDLYSADMAQKAKILCRSAFGRDADTMDIQGIQSLDETTIRNAHLAGKHIRLIINCTLENNRIDVKIEPISIDLNHPFAQVSGQENAVLIRTQHNEILEMHGTGTGRWPIAEAVFADLLDLSNQVNRNQLQVNYRIDSKSKDKALEKSI